ncbi:MAG: asparagine synthetase B, partial [Candidatus Aenigmatarchaeota archaeon]
MCGIAGYFGTENKPLLRKMLKTLKHRGPDDSGILFDKNIALGNRRLSIIDIKLGKQPIHNEK